MSVPLRSSQILALPALLRALALAMLMASALLADGPTEFVIEDPIFDVTANGEDTADEATTLGDEPLDPPASPPSKSSIFELPTDDDRSCVPTSRSCTAEEETASFPTVRLTGFFQADIAWFHQDAENRIAVGDIQDGADFRRARLAAVGDVAENVNYFVEFDFGFPGRPSFMDVWLNVSDLPFVKNVTVGQYRQPFGLDGLTSVKELTFIERGLPFAFLPFRQIGVMAHGVTSAEYSTWAVSGFRFPTDPFGGQVGDDGGYGMASRLSGVLLETSGGGLLHGGAAYSVIDPANDAVRYLSQPEAFLAETGGAAFVPAGVPTTVPAFVDTGVIPVDRIQLYAAELAMTAGSFHSQAEAIFARVNRPALSTVGFSGVSAQFAYLLTGEHRPYNRKKGILGRVIPAAPCGSGGIGAWEVGARGSWLDLTDADVAGGTLATATVGLNWYLNQFTKLQLNYVRALLDSPSTGDSHADIVVARAHLDF